MRKILSVIYYGFTLFISVALAYMLHKEGYTINLATILGVLIECNFVLFGFTIMYFRDKIKDADDSIVVINTIGILINDVDQLKIESAHKNHVIGKILKDLNKIKRDFTHSTGDFEKVMEDLRKSSDLLHDYLTEGEDEQQ